MRVLSTGLTERSAVPYRSSAPGWLSRAVRSPTGVRSPRPCVWGAVHGIEPVTATVRETMEQAERAPPRYEDVGRA